MTKNKLLYLMLVLIVTGCTNKIYNQNYSITEKNKHKGLALLSISQTGEMQNVLFVKSAYTQYYTYKKINTSSKNSLLGPYTIKLNILTNENDNNPALKGVVGEIQLLELEPGDYSIQSYSIDSGAFLISWDNFHYDFSVKTGEISYIGNINADIQVANKSLLSSLKPSSFKTKITISNRYERDVMAFRNKFPRLYSTEVLNHSKDISL